MSEIVRLSIFPSIRSSLFNALYFFIYALRGLPLAALDAVSTVIGPPLSYFCAVIPVSKIFLVTKLPTPLFLFRACNLPAPMAFTAGLLIINSPGVTFASIESVSPDPGTKPPAANLLTTPPELIAPGPPPILLPKPFAPPDPLTPLKKPLPNCTAACAPLKANITPRTGRTPLILSAALIRALVTDSAPLAMA